MAVINKYTAHTIEPDILSRLNVDQAGDVVSAETWVALWKLVLHLLGKYNEHFVDIYRTLGELGEELDTCVKRVDTLEGQYQGLVDRMGNLETSWSALQEAYNKVAGCYDEIKQIQNTLESGFIHYGEEPPTTDFIKLWVMPTQGVPSLITSWGENDILATNYNYASAKLIKDTLNTKVNKAGDTLTGPLVFNTDDDTDHDIVFGKAHGKHTGGASLGGHRARNVGAPTEDTDAATKEYVDTALVQAKEYSDTHQDLNEAVDSDILNWESGKVYKTTTIKGQAVKCGTHTSEEKYDSGIAVVFKSTQENNEVSVILIALGVSSNLWCNYTVFYEGTTIRTVYPEKESNYGLTQTLVGAADPYGDGAIKYPSAKAVKLTIDALLDSFYDYVSKNIEPKLVSYNPSIVLTEWEPDRVYRTGSIAGKTIYLQNTYLVDYTMPDGIAWVQNISETSTERSLRVYVLSSEGNAIINLFYNPTEPNNVAYHKYSVVLHDIARLEEDLQNNYLRKTSKRIHETERTFTDLYALYLDTHKPPLDLVVGQSYVINYIREDGTTGSYSLKGVAGCEEWNIPEECVCLYDEYYDAEYDSLAPDIIIADHCHSQSYAADYVTIENYNHGSDENSIMTLTITGLDHTYVLWDRINTNSMPDAAGYIKNDAIANNTIAYNKLKPMECVLRKNFTADASVVKMSLPTRANQTNKLVLSAFVRLTRINSETGEDDATSTTFDTVTIRLGTNIYTHVRFGELSYDYYILQGDLIVEAEQIGDNLTLVSYSFKNQNDSQTIYGMNLIDRQLSSIGYVQFETGVRQTLKCEVTEKPLTVYMNTRY